MSSFVMSQLPTCPTNIIFTGVAGTGKTHHLLHIQRLYDETLTLPTQNIAQQLLADISWREVVCAVLLLENRAMRVAEIVQHALFLAKADANGRSDNLAQTARGVLQSYRQMDSSVRQASNIHDNTEASAQELKDNTKDNTMSSTQASVCYFAQSADKSWYLLDAVKPTLTQSLSELITLAHMLGIKSNNSTLDKVSCSDTNSNTNTAANPSLQGSHTLSRSTLVSFHQAYGYDEFVEGIRPQLDEQSGQMRYRIVAGAFLELCQRAKADPMHRYAMLIDELNRANVAQVFGELMSAIEPDKRAGQSNALTVRLAYSGQPFSVPSNVDIYATMNTQDRSLVALDMAFRRRFEFIEMLPDVSMLPVLQDESANEVDLAQLLQAINNRITQKLGAEAILGQAFLCHVTSISHLAKVMARQILPQLINTIETYVRMEQVAAVMQAILYGDDKIIDNNLITKAVHTQAQQPQLHTHNTPHERSTKVDYPLVQFISAQNNTHIQIAPDLLMAAQYTDLSTDIDKNICAYLSAAPYQQIYSHYEQS